MRSDNMPRPVAPEHSETDIVERLLALEPREANEISEVMVAAADEIERLRSQNTGLLDQHSRDSKELRKLCEERDDARRSASYWKAEHLAGNVELSKLRERMERAKSYEVFHNKDEWAYIHATDLPQEWIGKRVRLVVCDE